MINFLLSSFVVATLSLFGLSEEPKVSIILAEKKDNKQNAIIVASANSERFIEDPLSLVGLKEGGGILEPIKISKDELQHSFRDVIFATPLDIFSMKLFFKTGVVSNIDYSKEIAQVTKECKNRRPCDIDVVCHFNAEDSENVKLILSKNRDNLIQELLQQNMFKTKFIYSILHGEDTSNIFIENSVYERDYQLIEIIVK